MSARETTGRLVARSTELTQLGTIFRDIRSGQSGRGRLVILSGDSGIGKTAIAQAFLAQTRARHPEVVQLTAHCDESLSESRPYGPFRDMLAQLAGGGRDNGLESTLSREAPAWLPHASASAGRSALFDQFVNFCRAISRQRPLVMLIDDVQWSDRSSFELLARLGGALGSLPMLIMLTHEPGDSAAAGSIKAVQRRLGPNALELMIRALEPEAVGRLAEAVLDGSCAKELVSWLVRASQGNPLRAEHLLRGLAERGGIRKRLFRFSLADEDVAGASQNKGDIIGARLDAAEPNLRWTLEAAALGSCEIDSAVLAAQLGIPSATVRSRLRTAQERGFVVGLGHRAWPQSGPSARYLFRHPLIRRVLKGRVSGKRRAHLLSRAAERLEQLADRGGTEIADEIASLYILADDPTKVREWAGKAADLAERLYAVYEVESFLRTAARTTDDELVRLRLESRLARVYGATGREPEAKALLETAYERARELGDAATQLNAGTMLGWLQLERGVPPLELAELANQLLESARAAGGQEDLVLALDLSCVVAERLGRAEETLLMAEEAIHVAEQSGNAETVAQAAYRLARVHVSWGSPEDGRVLAQRALELFAQLDEPGGVAVCHDLLGLANFRAGDWDAALGHWEDALESTELAGVPDEKINMQVNIAELLTLRGEFDRALRLFSAGLRLAEELDDQRLARRCRTGIARLEFERGEYPHVLQLTEEIRRQLPESGAWRENFQTTVIRALSYLELGDELQAWQEAARLERLYQGKDGWFERRAEGDSVRIRVIDLDADAWLAGIVAQQGIEETADKDPYGEGFLQYHQAHVFSKVKPVEALAAAERAVELFERLGARPMLAKARELRDLLAAADGDGDGVGGAGIDEDKMDEWFESLEG